MNNECIFCKIINNEIPSKKVYEDNDFLAILDVSPATKGHVLILPKEHAETLVELSDDKSSKIIILAKKIIKAMMKVYGFSDYNLIQNNGKLAGQSVNHFHLHLIPRYGSGEVGLWTPHANDESVTDENAKLVYDLLK